MGEAFEYTGGCGMGPCGSMPVGSRFEDENVGPARPDVPVLDLEYENKPLIITTGD